jgi:hypothetical protein
LPNVALDLPKIEAVINPQRSDLAAAIQLGTAAFPETGRNGWSCFRMATRTSATRSTRCGPDVRKA